MSMQPELESAIDDIVNESIVNDDEWKGVEINTDDLRQPDQIKSKIRDEFDFILKLLNFGNMVTIFSVVGTLTVDCFTMSS
jgi:hypothetical protein